MGEQLLKDDFIQHILAETAKAKQELDQWLRAPGVTEVGCIDKLTRKGHKNPPGSAIFLYNERNLLPFYEARRGLSGVFYVHLRCGYMFSVMNLHSVADHQRVVDEFMEAIVGLNASFAASFQVVVEQQGSAAPYMRPR